MFDARDGLATLPSAAGITVSYRDFQQSIRGDLAARRVLLDLMGGEGVFDGGAQALADLPTGTQYPAVTMAILDDSGEAWWFRTAAATDITFTDTSGACSLYAVPTQLAGVSPVAASGGRTQVQFVAQLTASAAPAHSLLLGAGSVTASAFTTWTEASGLRARMTTARLDPEYGAWHDVAAGDPAVYYEGIGGRAYYRFVGTTTDQDEIGCVVKWRVPDDFLAWHPSTPVQVAIWTTDEYPYGYGGGAGGGEVDFATYRNAVAGGTKSGEQSTSAWELVTFTEAQLAGGTWVPGDVLTLEITMKATDTAVSRVAEILITYLRRA